MYRRDENCMSSFQEEERLSNVDDSCQKSKATLPFSRKPLVDMDVNCPLPLDDPLHSSTNSVSSKEVSLTSGDNGQKQSWDLEAYSAYLRAITPAELFSDLKRSVLDHVNPDDESEYVDWLVMEFLRDGCDDEPPQKKFYKQRRRRRTADIEIAESLSSLMSPIQPSSDASAPSTAAPLRRSRRLRKSLALYRGNIDERSKLQAVQPASGSMENEADVKNIDAAPTPMDHQTDCDPLENNPVLVDELESGCIITPELECIYKNKNYSAPPQSSLATIFEVPRRLKGESIPFSKDGKPRTFDFSEGYWYYAPNRKVRLRIKKAKMLGWNPKQSKDSSASNTLLMQYLHKLDELCLDEQSGSSDAFS